MKLDNKMLLYVVTDRSWDFNNEFYTQVESTLRAGATIFQLREKEISFEEYVNEAKRIKEITNKYNVPLIINDNIDVAITVLADGVHVGQSDMDTKKARELIGNDKILGVSVQTVKQAILAQENGADYLGVGAVFNTTTKNDADSVSIDTLKSICNAVSIPVVAIGGINENNILKLKQSGIKGVAVISAIFAKPDVFDATSNMLNLAKEVV